MATVNLPPVVTGKGGAWILADGKALPVEEAEHYDTAQALWGYTYGRAYAAGYIRVSFYATRDDGHSFVTLTDKASAAALRTLARLLRQDDYPGDQVQIEQAHIGFSEGGRIIKFEPPRKAGAWAAKQGLVKALADKAGAWAAKQGLVKALADKAEASPADKPSIATQRQDALVGANA